MTEKRLMAIDPGSVRIGIALSDPGGSISRPLTILKHVSRSDDANRMAKIANENAVEIIIIGISFDEENLPTPSSKNGLRLADELKKVTKIPIIFWDEFETTNEALKTKVVLGVNKKNRRGHHDDLAASILLKSFIESHQEKDQD